MKRLFLTLLVAFFSSSAFAFLAGSEKFGYSIDFPEGFEITQMENNESSIIFNCKYLEVETLIRVWGKERFKDSEEAMKNTMTKLEAGADFQETTWRRQNGTIAQFKSPLLIPGEMATGWGFTISLPAEKGFLTVLTYTKQKHGDDLMQVMVSILDSVMIDPESFCEPGIMTTTFFPREKPKSLTLKIGKKSIRTQIDEIDSEANQFVIDREFNVFKFYAENNLPEVFDAWTRFYRIIGKDAMLRVKRASFDIYAALKHEASKKDKENPEAAIAQMLLNWTQDFDYSRKSTDFSKADITNIPDVMKGEGSDCDGRSLLLVTLFKNMGIESCLFVSAEYSHAMVGAYLEGKQGQTITVDGKEFIVGETTAKNLTFGLMDANMQDRKKWITVEIY